MHTRRLAALTRPGFMSLRKSRFFSETATDDIRGRLLSEAKTAMKNKNSFTSTTIRSVLSEVYAADKASPPKVSSPAITSIIRKATLQRIQSAAKFASASRPDLAEKERREADILSALIPPFLAESEIDGVLRDVLAQHKPEDDPGRALGKVLGAFYTKVDKSTVDAHLVKSRAEALLSNHN
ncbi:hypothetical protein PILCRDRAFT_809970 [Piloderma croceum F 1598]|uniref:Altered inheritance of mitochondria protein 41 n=1 Tax=Piloderma croceum (strain F 1598) TaxID=765440 RepID=A0A0C3BZK5_PILCF|nr:hypothetical protein PILCRDRAFT_809970 [Piloderma croceum F 1598]